MGGGMRPEYGTGIMLSDEQMREVLGRIGGGGGGSFRGEEAATPAGGSPIDHDGGAASCRSEVSEGTR